MDYQKVLIETLGTVENGATFTRGQVLDALMAQGYAERTAVNALSPSRNGAMINTLLADGVIEAHGPRGYRIINNRNFKAKPRKNAGRVVYYEGKPKEGWQGLGLMSNPGDYEAELRLCGYRFAPGCWNLKLYADGTLPRKANWWLQYKNGKLFGSDAATLKANMPDVYESVIEDMKDIEDAS
jgi:hypothetical protein